ncbi:MAG: methylated-DNA--[protein]-cysteine S-methyltransferase [Gemmataceae bacterium]
MDHLFYATIDSDIGRLFVAATPRGLCCLRFLDNAPPGEVEQTLAELRKKFGVDPKEDPGALRELIGQVHEVVAGRLAPTQVPLDMPGGPFHQKVWQALVRVPWGQTVSYAELAKKAGKPRAVRAAASACARNPVAFIVPCHRVLHSGGGPGGYFYGLAVKRHLLERETARPKERAR